MHLQALQAIGEMIYIQTEMSVDHQQKWNVIMHQIWRKLDHLVTNKSHEW